MSRTDFAAEVRRRVSARDASADTLAAAKAVMTRGGESVIGLVFFGSRKSGLATNAFSAHDFFVVTRDYKSFYRSLRAGGATRRPPWLMTALNHVLPPNQVSLRGTTEAGEGVRAKCAIISEGHFRRETSEHRRDHFCAARLFQPAEILAPGSDTPETLLAGLVEAHRLTYRWVRPWLPETFDVAEYTRKLLEVSLRAEIRPEPASRGRRLWEGQQEYLTSVYALLLRELACEGQLVDLGGGRYRLAVPAGRAERFRRWFYLHASLVRTTARWAKHIVTFDGWLDYILHKVARHGRPVALNEHERRWPLILLWPRLFRYLRGKNRPED